MAKPRLKHLLTEDIGPSDPESRKRTRLSQSQMDTSSLEPKSVELMDSESKENANEHGLSQSQKGAAMSQNKTGVTRIRGKQTHNIASANSGDSQAAALPEIGVVEVVELIDFMCHEKVVVELCPKVNFITGQNGSGKSAILTALVIALGGSATSTNRASNLRGFVKEGQPRAIVRVQLRNRGTDAYIHDRFGNSIIIERQINRAGNAASQYKIKNGTTGEIVSRKKEDVVAITDHMAIQVDNPINILSQDAAREFLASTSADKMYNFFLKGTQLWQLSEDLKLVRQAITRAEASIEHKRSVLPEMKAEKRRWEQHYEDMRQARDLSTKMTSLSQQMAWAVVKEAETEAKKIDEGIEVQQMKIAKIDDKVGAEESAIDKIKEDATRIEEQAQAYLAQTVPLQAEKSTPQSQAEVLKDALRIFKQTEAEINEEARSTRERMESIEKQIEAERARVEDTSHEGAEKLEAAVAILEETIQAEQAQIQDYQAQQQEYEVQANKLRQEKPSKERELHRLQKEESEARSNLENLQNQVSNRLNAFGKGVTEALAMIEKKQWRSMRPVGPLGKYVKLRNPEWSRIIETTLDKSLNAFLVASHADRITLDEIFRKCRCQSRIVVCSQELFDYSGGEPDTGFLTMLRTLEFSNELVKRQLITLNRIEQIILVEKRAKGDQVMTSNSGGFPRNVVACLTLDGYNVGARTGGLASQIIQLVRPSSRLGEDIGQAIERESRLLENKAHEIRDAEHAVRQLSSEVAKLQKQHQKAGEEIRKCRGRISKAEADIQETKERLNSNRPIRIAALQSELEMLSEQMESIKTQFRDHISQQDLKEEELRGVENSIALIDNRIEAIRDKAERLQRQAEDKSSQCQTHSNNIEYWNAKRANLEEKIKELKLQQQDAQYKVGEMIADARKISDERVEVDHTPAALDQMITECRARLEEIERSSSMSLAEVAEKTQNHINAYNKAKDELKATSRLVTMLKQAHQRRLQKWTQFRDSMTVRTKLHFTKHLYLRGYTGKLEFDHSQHTLIPKVQTDQDLVNERAAKASNGSSSQHGGSGRQASGSGGHQRKDTKSLSGGERSFTTICLLLSLWETMNCPVRALDEFDVFMDAANRHIAMKMMVDSARSKSDTQFILITPQDMPSFRHDADITIFKLNPPARTGTLSL
ncbi:Structural maintenance of chromosomes protein 6 [Coemansia spiralis]|uniref:Structural maintenance of chromosomes protein 6 n=1 Tax=Coemansia spiralis TaxID=417178 RepID=A0A9W8L016_9FUNG|nr:Structural maintenance of chromosomes protein 6 [Coemansia spiralis]